MSNETNTIRENIKKIQRGLQEIKMTVPPMRKTDDGFTKNIDDEVSDEMDSPHLDLQKEDAKFILKCFKYLKKLGYIDSQYQFSEQFLGKNKYYFGMILCEQRHPSIDSIHNLIRSISQLSDGSTGTKEHILEKLYSQGESIITKRLLKYL